MKKFAAKYIYTLAQREPLLNSYVEVDDSGTVAGFGSYGPEMTDVEYVDGAIVPGFVNSHCHLELSYMKGMFRKGTGMAGFIDQINELRDTMSREEKTASIDDAMKLLWRRGVSAVADISNCSDSFELKKNSPMYTRTFLEVFGTEPQDCESVMTSVKELQKVAGSFGLDAAPTPHSCYTMSPDLLSASSAAALESGFLSYHSEESEEEEEMIASGCGKMYDNRVRAGMSVPPVCGKSSLEYFIDRLLAVRKAPFEQHILLVHEVCMTSEGMEAVKAVMKHPFVALCPRSNIFIHNALPPVQMLRKSGLTLTVGTDSLSSNDDLDIVSELLCLQENFPGLELGEMLVWACLNGAKFLSKENVLGTLEIGKKPGLVAISHLREDGSLSSASASVRLI